MELMIEQVFSLDKGRGSPARDLALMRCTNARDRGRNSLPRQDQRPPKANAVAGLKSRSADVGVSAATLTVQTQGLARGCVVSSAEAE